MNASVEKQMEALFGEDQDEEYSKNMDQIKEISATYEYSHHKRERRRSSAETEVRLAAPAAAGVAQVIELGKGTVGRCGVCRGGC